MRILIAEEALKEDKGHWPSYIENIVTPFRKEGDTIDILMHQEAENGLVDQLGGTPFLTRSCWHDKGSQGPLGGIKHNFQFFRKLMFWFKNHPPYDWVFALTMRLQHLLAFAVLARFPFNSKPDHFLLLFVQSFGHYDDVDGAVSFPKNPSNLLARFCFLLIAPAVRRETVVIAAETIGMQNELSQFSKLPVKLFPHPIALPRATSPESQRGPLVISCPGFARHEKGNDLLQEAILSLLEGEEIDRFHFKMQWPEPFMMPDGVPLSPHPCLIKSPFVSFLNEPLSPEDYDQWLAASDFIILPYRRGSYYNRLSRVAIEAASRGVPLIYTKGTWTKEIVDLVGSGVEISSESPLAIKEALAFAQENANSLRNKAELGAAAVRSFHSSANFRATLFRRNSFN